MLQENTRMAEYKPSSPSGIVYKLRNWKSQFKKNVLLKNELYLASPDDFNDPFDCKLFCDYTKLTEPELRKHIKHIIKATDSTNRYNDPEFLDHVVNVLYKEKMVDINGFQEMSEREESEQQNKCIGILSLSLKWNNLLMWGHYGDCHRGVCYGFHEYKLFETRFFGKAGKVHYSKSIPFIAPNDFSNEVFMKNSFIKTHTKAKDWHYEKEFRFLTTQYPNLRKREVIYPSECLKEIILGCQINPAAEKEIIDASRRFLDVRIYKAFKTPGKFKLSRKRVKT